MRGEQKIRQDLNNCFRVTFHPLRFTNDDYLMRSANRGIRRCRLYANVADEKEENEAKNVLRSGYTRAHAQPIIGNRK
jgi:hypothetical protein